MLARPELYCSCSAEQTNYQYTVKHFLYLQTLTAYVFVFIQMLMGNKFCTPVCRNLKGVGLVDYVPAISKGERSERSHSVHC
jgi:hypothetical protein